MEPMLKRLQKPSREDVDPPPTPTCTCLGIRFLRYQERQVFAVPCVHTWGYRVLSTHLSQNSDVLRHCSRGTAGAGLWEVAHSSKVCMGVRPH